MRRTLVKQTTGSALCIIFLMFLHAVGVLRPVENGITTAIIPLSRPLMATRTAVIEWLNTIFPPTPIRERKDLETRIRQLEYEVHQLRFAAQENETLKAQLSFMQEKKSALVPARIYGFAADQKRSAILIDKGSADGLTIGLPVIAEKGVLIGKIDSVSDHSSAIRLLTDHRSKVSAAIVREKSTILGIVRGQFGTSLSMNFILNTETIKNNESVVTAGLEEKIPAGLFIGTVNTVTTDPTDPFQRASITPALSYNTVRIVTVLK